MADKSDIEKLDPEKLLTNFSKTRTAMWFLVALAVHVVVVGALSVGYIRDTWIDPEAAQAREAKLAEEAAAKEAAQAKPPVATAPPKDTTTAESPEQTPETDSATNGEDDPRIPPHLKEAAKPEDIPTTPDLGLSIDETN